jgi:RluA family pseudouridine synthase
MLEILMQSAEIVAVNKPEGMRTLPGGGPEEPTALSEAQALIGERLYVVHRLDRETSGVLVFARNREAHRFINQQFSQRLVSKTYLALVRGALADDEGEIREPLREFGSGRVGLDRQRGKGSLTRYEVEERLGGFTLVRAHPLTGRRHQLRAHFYSLGHPIAGDPRYGSAAEQAVFPRLMLHARSIRLQTAPAKDVTIEAGLPASFRQAVEALRRSGSGPDLAEEA